METRKIFEPAGLLPPHGLIPVPAYRKDPKWRLGADGIWAGIQVFTLVLVVILGLMLGTRVHERIFDQIMTQFLLTALPALGFLFVFVNGGLDLSMGSVAALAGASAGLSIAAGIPPVIAVMTALLLSLLFGLVNAALVGAARLPGIVVTLAAGFLVRGLMNGLMQGRTIGVNDSLAGMPVLGWLAIIVLAAGAFLWLQFPAWNARTPASVSRVREIFQAGLPYVLSALVAGLFGLVFANRLMAASPLTGSDLELDLVLVMAMGGVCLYARSGNAFGVLPAALTLAVVQVFMAVLGINIFVQSVIKGVICLFSLGSMYFYHWIVGLIHRQATAGKTEQPASVV